MGSLFSRLKTSTTPSRSRDAFDVSPESKKILPTAKTSPTLVSWTTPLTPCITPTNSPTVTPAYLSI